MPMSAGYIPFHPNPSKPKYQPPAGAVDAHCHVFGPEATFPFAPKRKYTPCDAPKEKLFAAPRFPRLRQERDRAGDLPRHRQPRAGRCADCVQRQGQGRGVRRTRSFTYATLKALDAAGVKGVRFNFIKRLVDSTPKDVMVRIANRIAELGWHIVVYFEHADLDEMGPFLKSLPTTLVFDHMACPNVKDGVNGKAFQNWLEGARRQQDLDHQGDMPGALHADRPALRRRGAVRARDGRAVSRIACSGAPTGRIPTCRRRRRTRACWST